MSRGARRGRFRNARIASAAIASGARSRQATRLSMPRRSIQFSDASALLKAIGASILVLACSHPAQPTVPPIPESEAGRHHDQVAAQVQPYLDAELVSGLVVGLYDAGKLEVYGFGRGPNNKAPDGNTLFELGPVTKVYASILLADAVQRREVELDTPVAELMPPGVTVPTRDKALITLKHLATHSSGLPRLPPSLVAHAADPDPYRGYPEDVLYRDLIRTELDAAPGAQIAYSTYGSALLGVALQRKLGGEFEPLLAARVLKPLELRDTFVTVPAAAAPRRAVGTNDDLAPATPWIYGAMTSTGALISTAADQLKLIDAELDAASGGTQLPLRRALKLTQESVLEKAGENIGLGWMIDSAGRYWHNGNSGGSHAFLGFDPKTRRGVVLLASTSTSLLDRLADAMYKILEDGAPPVAKFPTAEQLAPLAGTYEVSGTRLQVVVAGKRLYVEGPGEPRHRMSPLSDHEFWIEVLQGIAVFDKEGDKVVRLRFGIGDRTLSATRVDPNAPPVAQPAPAPAPAPAPPAATKPAPAKPAPAKPAAKPAKP